MKKISVKKGDSLIQVSTKLKSMKNSEVYIEIEKDAKLFSSKVNLQILKKESEKQNVKLNFVTKSKSIKKLAESLDINILTELKTETPKKQNPSEEKTNSKTLRVHKLDLGSNKARVEATEKIAELDDEKEIKESPKEVTKNSKKLVSKKKIGSQKNDIAEKIAELEDKSEKHKKKKVKKPESQKKKKIAGFVLSVKSLGSKLKPKSKLTYKNKKFLKGAIAFLGLSSALIVFVIYLTYPKATVHLIADSVAKEDILAFQVSKNITIVDRSQKIVPGEVVWKEFEYSKEFETQGFRQEGTGSSGTVTLKNELFEPRGLIANTQLITNDGLIFRMNEAVTVPAATRNENGETVPGEITVSVRSSDDEDNPGGQNNGIGEQYNLQKGEFMNIRRLSAYLQDFIYAEATDNFSGATTTRILQVSNEEIEKAKNETVNEAVQTKVREFRTEVQRERNDLIIPEEFYWHSIEYTNSDVTQNDEINKFIITTKIKVNLLGIKKDQLEELVEILSRETLRVGEKFDRARIGEVMVENGQQVDPESGSARATTIVDILISADIDEEDLKRNISGKTIMEAKKYLSEMGKVKKIEKLEVTPPWFNKLPSLSKNIDLEIKPSNTISEDVNG